MQPKALNGCPKCNISPNLVTLIVTYESYLDIVILYYLKKFIDSSKSHLFIKGRYLILKLGIYHHDKVKVLCAEPLLILTWSSYRSAAGLTCPIRSVGKLLENKSWMSRKNDECFYNLINTFFGWGLWARMDHHVFQFATRGQCIKGKQC